MYGFHWASIWEHGDNASLREMRDDPNVLLPGDVVAIPKLQPKEEVRATGAHHRFRRKGIPPQIHLQLVHAGKPRAHEPYILEIDESIRYSDKTNADGELIHAIPAGATMARLIMRDGAEVRQYWLGALDPISEWSGVQQRLANLGYYRGPFDGDPSDETASAIRAFQDDNKLDVSGELDDTTRDLLQTAHVV